MRREAKEKDLPTKANLILNGILVVMILIIIRIWHLAVFQHEEKVEDSLKRQQRKVVERCERATISDRFGIPLASNRVQYNVAISYGGIREIPRTVWQMDERGKKIKFPARKEYITQLSKTVANELEMDAQKIEDLIHSRAALFGNVPFVIKENISEEKFYRLKMLEKDLPGLVADASSKRYYPRGKVAGDVLGYLGAISREEYMTITEEMEVLRKTIDASEEGVECDLPKGYTSLEEVSKRLRYLEMSAYSLTDLVGKAGIEKSYDEKLRGLSGAKSIVSNPRGLFLEEVESHQPKPGVRLRLSISAELQEYAEQLLTEYEQAPIPTALMKLWSLFPEKQPWIKGGGIVVMDPKSGQIYALASYPRFDPGDFIKGQQREKVGKWLESESYLAELWNHTHALTRERFDTKKGIFFDEEIPLTWRNYLRMILPKEAPVLKVIEKRASVGDALFASEKMERLFSFFPGVEPTKVIDFIYVGKSPIAPLTLPEKEYLQKRCEECSTEIEKIKEEMGPYFSSLGRNDDKLLLIDLYRVACDGSKFTKVLHENLKDLRLEEYTQASSQVAAVKKSLQKYVKEAFVESEFKKWRADHFKDYLAKKRNQEVLEKRKWPKPYIEYLNEAEKILFDEFWKNYQWKLLYAAITGHKLGEGAKIFEEKIRLVHIPEELKKRLIHIETSLGIDFLKSFRTFEEMTRELYGKYSSLRQEKGKSLEKHLAVAFYPKSGFGYARSYAFRQSASIGSVFKLVPAYEAMRQRYLAMKESGKDNYDINPLTIIDDYESSESNTVAFTSSHKPIPKFYRGGRIARTDHKGVGQIDVVGAIEASSNPYFALLAADHIHDPEDLCKAAEQFSYGGKTGIDLPGEIKGNIPLDVTYNRTGLYSLTMGQHSLVGTPLQNAVMLSCIANGGKILKPQIVAFEGPIPVKPEVKRVVFLPEVIRKTLLKGMKQVVMGERGTARMLKGMFPETLLSHVIGKTSTAESLERMSLDGATGKAKCKHLAFNAISFEPGKEFENPELVVIVYLRYGEFGRLAAPYALKLIQKWEEIQKRKM